MQNTINRYAHSAPHNLIGTIKVTPEAEYIFEQLGRKTGLSGRSIISQIVVQAADMIEIVEV